ncbi:hypothetical protein HDU77_005042 [Chytriomyces hyalinus]|nr:hypothetical protein HDU77_005042 [Chytriomyces hyalinus]
MSVDACQSAVTPFAKLFNDCNITQLDFSALSNFTAAQTTCLCIDANVKTLHTVLTACQPLMNMNASAITTMRGALTAECAKKRGVKPQTLVSRVRIIHGMVALIGIVNILKNIREDLQKIYPRVNDPSTVSVLALEKRPVACPISLPDFQPGFLVPDHVTESDCAFGADRLSESEEDTTINKTDALPEFILYYSNMCLPTDGYDGDRAGDIQKWGLPSRN